MWEIIINYFARRHILTNILTLAVYVGGIMFWFSTPKEELPDIEFNFVSVSTSYPGASPEEVEHFITKPIEDEIRGIDGLYEVRSTSTTGSSSIIIEINDDVDNLTEVVNDITDAVNRVSLPDDVRDEPYIRRFKTSQKAIIDVAVIDTKKEFLDDDGRKKLQKFAYTLEQQLLNLPEVNSVKRSGYLEEEIHIKVLPDKLYKYNIPMGTIKTTLQNSHVRQPAGNLDDYQESKVTLLSELNNSIKLKSQIIRGGFEGQEIRLKDIAEVSEGFEKTRSITKINGYEAIILNVVKTSSFGIIDAVDSVKKKVNFFIKNNLKNKSIKIVLLDDESLSVRDRLSLIGMNGALGFVLILITLFVFLNKRAGFWVAMGIPFSFCFTMIVTSFLGYTINNVTLAAVIIVMGMIVDDAIVVAENISRYRQNGYSDLDAAVKGASYVFLPIVGSIVTTCIAFMPMLFFEGRFAKFIYYIPPIISIMLLGSLLESILILPAHMNLHIPRQVKSIMTLGIYNLIEKKKNIKKLKSKKKNNPVEEDKHWFLKVENLYGNILENALRYKIFIFGFFIFMLIFSGIIFSTKIKFVMFPDEEATEIRLSGEASEHSNRYETARLSKQVENIFSKNLNKEVVGFRTYISQSAHGRNIEENKFLMRIELVPREERSKSLKVLKEEWMKQLAKVKDLYNISFAERRFGQSSGTPIEIHVKDNNDLIRRKVVDELFSIMDKHPALINAEIDRPITSKEYKLTLNRDKLSRLSIKPIDISVTIRGVLEGLILYELNDGDEERNVRLSVVDFAKKNLSYILNLPVENASDYLVPLKDLIKINESDSPNAIDRHNYKRVTRIYSDLYGKESNLDKNNKNNNNNSKGNKKHVIQTPLEIANYFENNVFPKLLEKYPTTVLSFEGEIKDTKESKRDFLKGIFIVLFLIYSVLALIFNSLLKPLIIMIIIPFGFVGVVLAFWLHGISFIGFFAVVGTIGLAGVVVNDAIVMIVKLEREYDLKHHKEFSNKQIANIAKTRLRAVMLTTLTTVAGLMPTAYGIAGYDSMLAEMMFAMGWGLLFATLITLFLVPSFYSVVKHIEHMVEGSKNAK